MALAEAVIPRQDFRPPLSLILGERNDILAGHNGLEGMMQAAMADEGDFWYEPPVSVKELRLPPPDGLPDRSVSVRSVIGFFRNNQGRVCTDEACNIIEGVVDFVAQLGGDNDRQVLFEAPFERWARSDSLAQFLSEVRDLYGIRTQAHCLRNDTEDPHGTTVYYGRMAGNPFLFVERDVVNFSPAGRRILNRRLEIAGATDSSAILGVVNEFSLQESIRIKALLSSWQVSDGQRRHVLERANRQTVRSDEDVRALLEWRHAAPPESWRDRLRAKAASAIGRLLTPPDWFVPVGSRARHQRLS